MEERSGRVVAVFRAGSDGGGMSQERHAVGVRGYLHVPGPDGGTSY